MKALQILLASAGLFVLSYNSHAETKIGLLLERCQSAIDIEEGKNAKGDQRSLMNASSCYGYIHAIEETHSINSPMATNPNFKICLPAGSTYKQLVRIFVSAAKENPQIHNGAASDFLPVIYSNTFPCDGNR